MSRNRIITTAVAVGLTVGLSACGGASETHVASTPAPTPPPPPPPPPAQASAEGHFGVTVDTTFPAVGDATQFKWSEADKAYTLVTSTSSDKLKFSGANDSNEEFYPTSGNHGVRLLRDSTYQYTNVGVLFELACGAPAGAFAYGIPTAAADVPASGTASYTAKAIGGDLSPTYDWWDPLVGGQATLDFDFSAGTLGGHFDATITNSNGNYVPLARYDFVNTVFGSGSTTFSGGLQTASINSLGSFNGLFTGPHAAELMAQWSVPYINPANSQPGTITGVWIGKKN